MNSFHKSTVENRNWTPKPTRTNPFPIQFKRPKQFSHSQVNSFHNSTVENKNWTPKCYNYSIFHWLRSSQLYRDIYVQKDLTYRQRMDIIARRASRRGDTNNGAPSSSQSQAIQGRARSQDSHTNVGLELQRGGVVSVQTQPRSRGAPRAVATSREGSSGVSVLQESSLDSLVGFSSEGGSGSRGERGYRGARGTGFTNGSCFAREYCF